MVKSRHMPWGWLILAILSDKQFTSLREIYSSIEEMQDDIKTEYNSYMINPALLKVDLTYGDRPKYTHAVRAALSNLKKAGYIEHIDRAVYSLTPSGKQRLNWYQTEY